MLVGAVVAGLLVMVLMMVFRPRPDTSSQAAAAPASTTALVDRSMAMAPAGVSTQVATTSQAGDARLQIESAPPAAPLPRSDLAGAAQPVAHSAVAVTPRQATPAAQAGTTVIDRAPAAASPAQPAPGPAVAANTSAPDPGAVTAAPVASLPSSPLAAAPQLALARPVPAVVAPPAMSASTLAAAGPSSDIAAAARRRRDEQVDAAEAAMRRGDHAGAIELLTPLANAGLTRAQALLGRTYEERGGRTPNNFEAYIWYSVAARGGESGASTLKDRVAGRLQPAEIRQAEQIIERWKPRISPGSAIAQ
jgi:localization factor PodJL